MSRSKEENNILGISIYRQEDWDRLLEISDDRDYLEDTWLEWNESVQRFEDTLRQKGIEYKEIIIDLDELIEYCKKRGFRINGESRSQFTAEKLRKLQ